MTRVKTCQGMSLVFFQLRISNDVENSEFWLVTVVRDIAVIEKELSPSDQSDLSIVYAYHTYIFIHTFCSLASKWQKKYWLWKKDAFFDWLLRFQNGCKEKKTRGIYHFKCIRISAWLNPDFLQSSQTSWARICWIPYTSGLLMSVQILCALSFESRCANSKVKNNTFAILYENNTPRAFFIFVSLLKLIRLKMLHVC